MQKKLFIKLGRPLYEKIAQLMLLDRFNWTASNQQIKLNVVIAFCDCRQRVAWVNSVYLGRRAAGCISILCSKLTAGAAWETYSKTYLSAKCVWTVLNYPSASRSAIGSSGRALKLRPVRVTLSVKGVSVCLLCQRRHSRAHPWGWTNTAESKFKLQHLSLLDAYLSTLL
jgi:hypothetical protein